MMNNEAKAFNEKKDKEELLMKLHDLITEYAPRLHPMDLSAVFDYSRLQILSYHFCTAFEKSNEDMDKLKQKGRV